METVTLYNAVELINKVLNVVDDRLKDHSKEVAYIYYYILKEKGGYSEKEMQRFFITAMFHDIGAYKVETRTNLVEFEVKDPHSHSIYGYLFVRNFFHMNGIEKLIKYHHMDWNKRSFVKDDIPEEAFMLHLADRICIMLKKDGFHTEMLNKYADASFAAEHIEWFLKADRKYELCRKIKDESYKKELADIFGKIPLAREESINYASILSYMVDFYSSYTVIHNILVKFIAMSIATLMNIDKEGKELIAVAASVHDIGKIAIPVEILEKEGGLTKDEFEIMKSHVLVSKKILDGFAIKEVRDIAILHHEKLDGTGYPYGLKGDELSLPVRIVAIADIVSALAGRRSYKEPMSKEQVINILSNMAKNNKIDREITKVLIENYDAVEKEVREEAKESLENYRNMAKDYAVVYKELKELG